MEILTNSMQEIGCPVVFALHLEILYQLLGFIHQIIVF